MILIDLSLLIVFIAMAKALGGKALAAGKVETGATGIPFYFELGIGFGIIAYAVFFLGLTVGLKAVYFEIAALIMLVLWHKELLRALREGAASFGELAAERHGTLSGVLLALLLVSVIFNIFFNYAPPAGEDELLYHLNLPLKYLAHGGIFNMPENVASCFFLTLDLLYVPLMAVKSVFAAKLLSAAFGIFDMALVYLLTREFVEKRCALLAAVLFYTAPMTIGLAGVGKIDAGVVFYALLALWSFLKYSRAGLAAEKTWFVLFSLCSGMLMSTKSTGPFFIAAFTIMLTAVQIGKKKGAAGTVKAVFAYGFTCLLFILPWLAKNMLWTGNPFYPAKILPGLPFDETFYFIAKVAVAKSKTFIIEDYFFGTLMGTGYLIAAFLPLYFILKNKKPAINTLLLFAGLLAAILYASGYAVDLARYTYCNYAIFAVAAAYAITALSETEPRLKRFLTVFVPVMILVPGVCTSVYFGARRLPYILGFQSADQYLQKQYEWEGWDTVKWVADNIPPDARILYLGEVYPFAYYYKQTIIGGNRPSILGYSLSGAKEYLKENNIAYLLVCGNRYTEANGVLYHYWTPLLNVRWFEGTSIDREFVRIYSNNGTRIYRIEADNPAPRTGGRSRV